MLDSREHASKSSSHKSHLMCPASKPEHHKPHFTDTHSSPRPLTFGHMNDAAVIERAASEISRGSAQCVVFSGPAGLWGGGSQSQTRVGKPETKAASRRAKQKLGCIITFLHAESQSKRSTKQSAHKNAGSREAVEKHNIFCVYVKKLLRNLSHVSLESTKHINSTLRSPEWQTNKWTTHFNDVISTSTPLLLNHMMRVWQKSMFFGIIGGQE